MNQTTSDKSLHQAADDQAMHSLWDEIDAEPFAVFSTAELFAMGMIDETVMEQLMEPLAVATA